MLIHEIDNQEIAALARQLIAIDSANPPGDVNSVARVVEAHLVENDISYRLYRETSDRVNIVATVDGNKKGKGKHVVWNGHLDTFPISPNQHAPHLGDRAFVFGRGAVDMKGGVAGYLVALAAFRRNVANFTGRISLVLVCDEETFGPHGMNALKHVNQLFNADYVLTAEPSGRGVIRYGERGPIWGRAIFKGAEGHAAYAGQKTNPIERASAFVVDISHNFHEQIAVPLTVIDTEMNTQKRGGQDISLNIGRVEGGIKVNMQPSSCSVHVDVRVPHGVDPQKVTDWLQAKCEQYDGFYMADVVVSGSKSDPQNILFSTMATVVWELTGTEARLEVASGSTDVRHWREYGIPAVQYGAEPTQQATSEEHVPVAELGEIAKIHALTTQRLLDS